MKTHGRSKGALAKVIASLGSALLIALLFVTLNLLTALLLYGTDGLHSSVLFCENSCINYIHSNIDCAAMLLYQILLIFSSIFLLTTVTLLISAVSKTQFIALAGSAFFFLFPLFFAVSESNPIFRLLVVFPIWQIQFSSAMALEPLFNSIPYVFIIAAVSVVLSAFCICFAKRSFSRHQAA